MPKVRNAVAQAAGLINIAVPTVASRLKLPADKANLSTNILNTAVQLAVPIIKA
jgi:hypothetical protein